MSPARARRPRAGAETLGPELAEFLHAQAPTIVACDFFCVETGSLRRYYVLFFIELQTCRVHLAGVTANPNGRWITQQARNLSICGAPRRREGPDPRPRHEVRGRLRRFFRTDDVNVVQTPFRAPQTNAHAERFVRTVRTECLDWPLILGPRHLDRVLRVYLDHYNTERPHRALGRQPPLANPPPTPPPRQARIERRDRLGGLLHEYHLAPA